MMEFDAESVEIIKNIMGIVQFIAIILIGVYSWWTSTRRATKVAIDRVDKHIEESMHKVGSRMDDHSKRLVRVEGKIEEMPSRHDMQGMHTRMNKLNREIGELTTALEATNKLLSAHQDYLMRRP